MPSADLTLGAFLSNRFNWNEWSVFHRRNSPIMTSMPRRMSDLLKRGCDPPYISKEVYDPFRAYLKWVYGCLLTPDSGGIADILQPLLRVESECDAVALD